eukprot:scaffold14825_cov20-Cyclotella_meneghiniana.AAC.2
MIDIIHRVECRRRVKVCVHGDNFVKHKFTCFSDENAYLAAFMTSSDDLVIATYEVRVSDNGLCEHIFADARDYNTTLRGKVFYNQIKCLATGYMQFGLSVNRRDFQISPAFCGANFINNHIFHATLAIAK